MKFNSFMKKYTFVFALVFSAFAMSACVKSVHGPSDNIADAQYVQSVHAAVDNEETIKFMDKVYWSPNMESPRMWSGGAFGTIVVTDRTLYFLFWNRSANAFDVLYKQPVADMVTVKHITSIYGSGDYVSIEDKNKRFDLYTCFALYDSDNMIEKNRELLDCLNAVRNAK